MAWFDRQEAIVCRLFREDRTADAVQEAIQTCRHLGPEPEPPALRDARADLLLRTIMAQIPDGNPSVTATNEETALLERRIFNWMHDGKDEEAERFPTYTPFDEGMDREPPQEKGSPAIISGGCKLSTSQWRPKSGTGSCA